MNRLSKILLIFGLLFTLSVISTESYGQYRDPSSSKKKKGKKKKGKSNLDKHGLFGMGKDGSLKGGGSDPFTTSSGKKRRRQYGETPPDRKKKPGKLRLFKNKKNKPPKHKSGKLKEKDSFSTKQKGKRYNKDYSKQRSQNKPKKKKKERKLYKKS